MNCGDCEQRGRVGPTVPPYSRYGGGGFLTKEDDMEDRHVRWATPTMSEVEWAQDRLPPYLNEKRVRDNLARAEAGAYVLVAADPMLHRVDDGDGTEACWFWRAHCLLVSTQESKARRKVVAIRLTSVAMHEAGDVAADMGEDFACQVLRFMRKVLKVEVVDVP